MSVNEQEPVSTEESELQYGAREPEVNKAIANLPEGQINLEGLPIFSYIPNIDDMPNEQYALERRNSFGASDISVLLGVNPYKSSAELIQEKTLTYLTAEEKAIGDKIAVKKGRDLEPLIIQKFGQYINPSVFKPTDMYKFKDYEFLTLNFDGVMYNEGGYIPVEIKVVTKSGERHYNPSKTIFNEILGFKQLREPLGAVNMSIQNKAAYYGIPPYYYCQLQMQIAALNAPYGYLATLFENTWSFHLYAIWQDPAILTDAVIQGYKAWEQVQTIKTRREGDESKAKKSNQQNTTEGQPDRTGETEAKERDK
jgi:hypothetical protein